MTKVHATKQPYESMPGRWWHPLVCGGWWGNKSVAVAQRNWGKVTCKKCLKQRHKYDAARALNVKE